jgi:hypothetical protein
VVVRNLVRVGVLIAFASAPVLADTISLKNGRRIEGRIVSQSESAVKIEVPGGLMDLPRSQIASIEERLSIEDDYAARYARVPLDDPSALERLAAWARRHQLEEKARALEEHARGIRLEARFAQAKTANDFLEVASWSSAQGFSHDVQRLALSRALEVDPTNATAKRELDLIAREEELEVRAEQLTRERRLEERERAVKERERLVAQLERELHERRTAPPPVAEPPEDEEGGVRDGGEPPPPDGSGVLILRRPRPRPEDDSLFGTPNHKPPTPQPQGSSSSSSPRSPNPLPAAPQLPPTLHQGSSGSTSGK